MTTREIVDELKTVYSYLLEGRWVQAANSLRELIRQLEEL